MNGRFVLRGQTGLIGADDGEGRVALFGQAAKGFEDDFFVRTQERNRPVNAPFFDVAPRRTVASENFDRRRNLRRDVDVFKRSGTDVFHSRQRFELAVDKLQFRRFDRDVEFAAQYGDLLRGLRFDAVRAGRSRFDRDFVVQNGLHGHFDRLFFPRFQDADSLRRARFAGRDEEFDVLRVAVPDVAQAETVFVFDAPFDRVAPFDPRFQNRLDDLDAGSRRRSFALETADEFERAPFLRRHRQFEFRRSARIERSDFPNAASRFAVEPDVARLDLRVADFRVDGGDRDRFRQLGRYDQLPRRDAPDVARSHFERRLLPDD